MSTISLNNSKQLEKGQIFSQEVPQLLQKHLEHLLASAISIDVIKERGYRSILGKKELGDLGFSKAQCRVPGILMPIWSPNGNNTSYQFRPDNPRLNNRGKPVKYETPKNSRLCLDVPPHCLKDITDPHVSLFITEGIKKGDSLASHNACAVSLLGVWGFVGRNIQGGVTTLAEWRDVALNGRIIYICYDSDVITKRQVQQALDLLVGLLKRRAASQVLVISLPSPTGEKVGIDDFLVSHSLNDVVRLAKEPEQASALKAGYRIENDRICRVLIERGGTEKVQPLCNFVARVAEDITRDDGIEQSHYFLVEGQLAGGCSLSKVQIPAASFANLGWVTTNWGVKAVIAAGISLRDCLREAIQLLSSQAQKRSIYSYTGWRSIDGRWIFLNAGTSDIDVELPQALKLYHLPQSCDDPTKSMGASLRFLDTATYEITIPLYSAVFAAPLSEIVPLNLTEFLFGITGSLKTTLACLAISHFGGPFSRSCVPATFEATENYLERLMCQAKDVLLLIDDYFPQPTEAKAKIQEQTAQRIIRSQSGHVGRGRLRADTSMRPTYSPRGLIVATGEMAPRGQSTSARMLTIDVFRDQTNLHKLSEAQSEAGMYPQAMRSYVDWLAPKMDKLKEELPKDFIRLRDQLRRNYNHLNLAEIVAQLTLGWDLILEHATEVGAITEKKRDGLLKIGFEILIRLGEKQEMKILAERPTYRFLDILRNLFAQKRIYLRDKSTDDVPSNYTIWGWEQRESKDGPYPAVLPNADFLGWLDEDLIYLLSEGSYKSASRFAREQGEPFTITKRSLQMQLRREKILIPVNEKNIVDKKIAGSTHRVIQLIVEAFQ